MMNERDQILTAIREGLKQAVLPDARPQRPVNNVPRAAATPDTFIAELTRVAGQVIRVRPAQEAAQTVADCVWNGIGRKPWPGSWRKLVVRVWHKR
ncbi:MAG: hypothetical protein IPL78_28730 [Chloroflexi bacterium]|nr:hypothetical protein [Chloroflexota bacterium]